MEESLFIDDNYLKTYSPLGKSIDVDEIFPFVSSAQSVYAQDILGTPLYNDFMTKTSNYIAGSGVTFSTVEWNLLDLVSKSLVYWTTYMALPHLYLRIRNAGVVKTNSENTTNSDLSEMKYLREEMKNLGEFWNTRCVNYICDNSISLPLYNAASKDIYPSNRQYDSDIYLEDGYKDLTFEELKFLKKYLS
jgi:hypothetical protein